MSSAGQVVGYVLGAVVGFFTGGTSYVALGAAIGGMIGSALDPPKGPHQYGPRLSDTSVQNASYGTPIPRIYGTVGLYGTVFWIENNQLHETKTTKKQGGKGGGGSKVTTYSYSVTCAILLCEGPIAGVRRIWAGSKLIYDAGDSSITGLLASGNIAQGITIYTGDETQTPNARMQMTLGANNVSAYRGKAYVVIEDFQLADYDNSLLGCPFKFEVMGAATYAQYSQPTYVLSGIFPPMYSYGPILGRVESAVFKYDHLGTTYTVTGHGDLVDTKASDLGTYPAWGHVGMLGNDSVDFDIVTHSGYEGWLTVGGGNLMYHYPTNTALPAGVWHMMAACVNPEGTLLYVFAHRQSDATNWLNIYDQSLGLVSQNQQSAYTFVINSGSFPAIAGTDQVIAIEAGGEYLWYASAYGGFVRIYPISSGTVGSILHSFAASTTPFMGPYGTHLTMAAADGLCWGAHDGGGMFVFSRLSVATPAQVALADIIEKECLSSGYLSSGDIDTTTIDAMVTGYKVTTNAAIRAALEALQGPYPFDVIQDGYNIKFVKRGLTSLVSVPYDDLGTSADNKENTQRITVVREMDSQLPRRVEITYFDASREYDPGEQAAERTSSTSTSLVRIEVPVVMTANEAAQCAETLIYLYHLERTTLNFSVPWRDPYNKLQPSDPITVVTPQATYFCRITEKNEESNRVINITAKLASVGIYSPTALGSASALSGLPISLCGPTIMDLLDIPTVSGYNDYPGVIVAARGAYTGWRGASIYRSDDGGATWLDEARVTTPGATVAVATSTLGAGATNAMDVAGILNVQILTGDFSTVSDLALFNGGNHFAYGAPGRWEIIGVKTVSLQGDGTCNLSNLLRGRYGSEWAMTTHQIGDKLVLLDATELSFAPCPVSILGSSRQWTALGYGDIDVAHNERAFTYAGTNMECLPPTYAKGYKNAGGDFVMEWVRRSRTDDSWRDYVDADIGDTPEAYQVEIYEGPSYATLKRTISGLTTPAATYTAAQQTTDFGAAQKYIYAKIYQVSTNVGAGYPLSSFIGNPRLITIQSLIHFDGAAGASIIDVTGNNITVNGSAAIIDTTGAFGGSCMQANQSSGYIRLPPILLSDTKWVIDFWFNPNALPAATYSGILQFGQAADGTGGFCVVVRYDGLPMCFFDYGVPMWGGGGNVSAGTWYHGFIQRSGDYLTMGHNGYTGSGGRLISNTSQFVPGVARAFDLGYANVTYIDPKQIRVDEFRAFVGQAPYPTSDNTAYAIPTAAFENP